MAVRLSISQMAELAKTGKVSEGSTTGTANTESTGSTPMVEKYEEKTPEEIKALGQQLKPDAVYADPNIKTSVVGTMTDPANIDKPEDVVAPTVTTTESATAQADQQAPITAATMEAATAGDLAATQAAQGTVTQTATAQGPIVTGKQ